MWHQHLKPHHTQIIQEFGYVSTQTLKIHYKNKHQIQIALFGENISKSVYWLHGIKSMQFHVDRIYCLQNTYKRTLCGYLNRILFIWSMATNLSLSEPLKTKCQQIRSSTHLSESHLMTLNHKTYTNFVGSFLTIYSPITSKAKKKHTTKY